MKGLVYRVAVGLAILHIAGGCCWHHAHGRENSAVPGAEKAASLPQPGAPCTPCGSRPSDGHEPAQPCAENSCDLVAGQRVQSGALASAWCPLAGAPVSADVAISRQATQRAGRIVVATRTPVRLHLLHQLLLI